MQINRTNNIAFNGIYKIPNTNIATYKMTKNVLEPICSSLLNEPVRIFYGDNPYTKMLPQNIDKHCKIPNTSYNWFRQNALKHDVHLPDLDNIDVWVVSGEKDVALIDDFYKKADKIFPKSKLSTKIIAYKNFFKYQDLPEHLRVFMPVVELNEKFCKIFNEQIKDKTIIKSKSYQEIFMKIVEEK